MDVLVTPSEQASVVLSSLASSKLQLSKEVSLTGESSDYWKLKRFYSILGINTAYSEHLLSILCSQAVAVAMSRASPLDRITSMLDTPEIPVYYGLSGDDTSD